MQGKGVKQRVHSGSCPRLPGMHIGFTWAGVLGGRVRTLLAWGRCAGRSHPGSAAWELGRVRWAVSEDSAL